MFSQPANINTDAVVTANTLTNFFMVIIPCFYALLA